MDRVVKMEVRRLVEETILIRCHLNFYHFQIDTDKKRQTMQANAGYEIPARLRTLHNLVIQYASQGRWVHHIQAF